MGPWLIAAGLNGLMAVAMGAFAAHGLRASLDPAALDWIDTASRYQLLHGVALFGVALLLGQAGSTRRRRLIHGIGWLFLAGIVLFAGSLYLLALTGSRAVAWITPLGGLALMGGWAALVVLGVLRWRGAGAE